MTEFNFLKMAQDKLLECDIDGNKHDGLVAQVAASIAIAEQLKRIADVLEKNNSPRGFSVVAETAPYQY